MCDRLPPQRIDARNMASLGQVAARAQALADDLADEPGMDVLLPALAACDEAPAAAAANTRQRVDRPNDRLADRLGDPLADRSWGRAPQWSLDRSPDGSDLRPEDRHALGRHAPAWPDLLPAQDAVPAPAWTRRLAAWLRESDPAEARHIGH